MYSSYKFDNQGVRTVLWHLYGKPPVDFFVLGSVLSPVDVFEWMQVVLFIVFSLRNVLLSQNFKPLLISQGSAVYNYWHYSCYQFDSFSRVRVWCRNLNVCCFRSCAEWKYLLAVYCIVCLLLYWYLSKLYFVS